MFYALLLNIGSLSGNFYINTMLLGLTNIPQVILGTISANTIGRRYNASLSMVLGGVSSLILMTLLIVDGEVCFNINQ